MCVRAQRVAVPLANQFVAVVGAQSTLAFERELHRVPVDLLNVATGLWHRNYVAHQHGYGARRRVSFFFFFVNRRARRSGVLVGVLNETLVLAGGDAVDVVGVERAATSGVTSVAWQPSNVSLLQCAENRACDECVFGNAYRNVVPCRWCFDAVALDGRCIAADSFCVIGTQRATVIAGWSISFVCLFACLLIAMCRRHTNVSRSVCELSTSLSRRIGVGRQLCARGDAFGQLSRVPRRRPTQIAWLTLLHSAPTPMLCANLSRPKAKWRR